MCLTAEMSSGVHFLFVLKFEVLLVPFSQEFPRGFICEDGTHEAQALGKLGPDGVVPDHGVVKVRSDFDPMTIAVLDVI